MTESKPLLQLRFGATANYLKERCGFVCRCCEQWREVLCLSDGTYEKVQRSTATLMFKLTHDL